MKRILPNPLNPLPETRYFPATPEGQRALRECFRKAHRTKAGRLAILLVLLVTVAIIGAPWITRHATGLTAGWIIMIPVGLMGVAALAMYSRAVRPILQRRLLEMGLCPLCGYSLYGNISGTCPECGLSLGSTQGDQVAYSNTVPPPAPNTSMPEQSVVRLCAVSLFTVLAIGALWFSFRHVNWVGGPKLAPLWGGMVFLSILAWGVGALLMLIGFVLGAAPLENDRSHSFSRLALGVGSRLGLAGFVVVAIWLIAAR
jgi:hypothetical protein